MEPNLEKQKKERLISWISFIVVLLVLGGIFWYLYQKQKDAIVAFQDSERRLQQENETANKTLSEMKKTLAKANDELAIIRFVCTGFTDCKSRVGEELRKQLLKRNDIQTAKEEGGGGGLHFYKYFLTPGNWDDEPWGQNIVTSELLAFVKKECPARIYDRQGFLTSMHRYRIDKTKVAEVLMEDTDDAPVEIMCAWIKDEVNKTFTKIQ